MSKEHIMGQSVSNMFLMGLLNLYDWEVEEVPIVPTQATYMTRGQCS
jgi:hypothetical protein